jgi:lipopolysaccharide export system protein LptC
VNPREDAGLLPALEATAERYVLPWYRGALSALSAWLPIILMALVALASWWLVRNTPVFQGDRPALAKKHIPDYTMHDFTVQRFAANGTLRAQIEGDVLRHYPDDETIEIDNARIRSISAEGRVTNAVARRAVSNADATEMQLFGDAHVVQQAHTTPTGAFEEAIDFRSEFLHVFLRTERIRSHLPVLIVRGTTRLEGGSMTYDNLDRIAVFEGRVKAIFGLPQTIPAAAVAASAPP